MTRHFRHAVGIVAIAVVSIWLFGDTFAHYSPARNAANVIRFAHFGTYQDYETWAKLIEAFESEHPEITVRQEYVVGWYGLYNAKLRQQMLAGTMPHVILVQIGPFTAMADRFADLTPLVESVDAGIDLSAFDRTAVDLYRFEGRYRAMPVSGGNLLIYCNLQCFERASEHLSRQVEWPNEDWTMDDFRRIARDLTCDFDADGRIDQFGFWQPRWVYYLPFIWSFGADLLDKTQTQWRLQGPEAEAAFGFYQEMRVGPQRYSPHPYEVSQIIQDVGFLTGKTAMCINGPWFQPFLADTKLASSYQVIPIPKGFAGRVTRITWDGIAMATDLDEQTVTQAWTFIRFVCGDQGQRILAATQRALPARTGTTATFDRNGTDLRAHRFVEALAYSRTQPRTPHFRTIDRAMNRNLRIMLDPDNPMPVCEFLVRLQADHAMAGLFTLPRER